MTFTPHGKHLIAGDWVGGAETFRSEPAHGPAHDFAVGTVDLVDRACTAAEDAFWSYGWTTRATRADFLDAIADEIFRLRDQKEQSELDSHHREEAMNRIKELQDFISKQKTDITEFDEALVKKLIEKITVFADHFTVKFKSGLAIEIEA